MDTKKSAKENLQDIKCARNGIIKPITFNSLQNFQNTTELDFSNQNFEEIDASIEFPQCLRSINLSHNKFTVVPKAVLKVNDLEVLDVSHNKIESFNDPPSFCHTLKFLNISNNTLKGPPLWIWTESPTNLSKLNISCNVNISNSMQTYIDEILQYNALVTHVILYNCRLGKHLKFLSTFAKAKMMELGTPDWSCYASNHLQEIPCQGLDKCYDIESLNLANTHIYNMAPEINMFKNLIQIDFSHNNLNGIPNEFCELENLEICMLSFNNLLYLPDNFVKLKKLSILCLDVNELCMIPQNINDLESLKTLDLYDNNLYEFPEGIKNIPEIDLAQNYFEEPVDQNYLDKRQKLRCKKDDRQSGRKYEIEKPESVHSPDTSDDDEHIQHLCEAQIEEYQPQNHPPSSPEDWDSDTHWEPHPTNYMPPKQQSYWLSFVTQKMKDGNLCPMDNHTVPVMDKVIYNKKCYPQEEYESDGQFDDLSGDDS
ncbi:hypothetical protein MSG28_003904 [Choristoneura fumiferana]|uniref:Uncharacterized protein n=1 Tax=Choristoneura fumiferana TaxID=7141 RepID=A0ACC0KH02_CHOFU|nr:hypothetical protein MSG28_003904 [Choristoneura fumiferana]